MQRIRFSRAILLFFYLCSFFDTKSASFLTWREGYITIYTVNNLDLINNLGGCCESIRFF